MWVYIYIYGCICVGLSVCSWMGGQRRDLIFGIFEVASECSEDLFCLFWREDRTKSCARENLQNRKKGRRTLVSKKVSSKWSVRHFRSQEWDSEAVSWEWDSEERSVGSETPKRSVGSETPKQISRNSHEHKYIEECLRVSTSLSCVCSSKSAFVCFFLPTFVFLYTNREMPTRPGVRRNIRRTVRSRKPAVCGVFHNTSG